MSNKTTIFYRKKQAVNLEYTAEGISSDGGFVISEKLEKTTGLLRGFSKCIDDNRHRSYTEHSYYKMVKQRVFLLNQGYEDANDEKYLRDDPVLGVALNGLTASQPTISRLETKISRNEIYSMSNYFVERYISSIPKEKKRIIIDVDSSDLETHGSQQMSMFNDFYGHHMYNPLFFHDGETGQLILPVLRAGNVHTSRGFVTILKHLVEKIKARRSGIKIIIRGDSGFSGAEFYALANREDMQFCVGISGNKVLQRHVGTEKELIKMWFLEHGQQYQYFTEAMEYQAQSWKRPEKVYAKVEATKQGMNIRFFCSNMRGQTAKELYMDFYVKRGDRSENRIKEVKSMCFSGRLSCHEFYANYFRIFLSALSYEMFRMLREKIAQTRHTESAKWQVANMRLFLLKVGTIVVNRARSITIMFSKTYICRDLLVDILHLMRC